MTGFVNFLLRRKVWTKPRIDCFNRIDGYWFYFQSGNNVIRWAILYQHIDWLYNVLKTNWTKLELTTTIENEGDYKLECPKWAIKLFRNEVVKIRKEWRPHQYHNFQLKRI